MATLVVPALPPPNAPRARSPRTNATIAVLTILLLAFPLIITGAVVPRFEEIFKDFGVALSAPTRLMVNIGRAASSIAGWAVISLILCAVILPLSIWASRKPSRAGVMLLLAVLLMLGYLGALVIAMFLPLTDMIESLQAGKSGSP